MAEDATLARTERTLDRRIEGLADTLKAEGVTHGYTIDGLDPFEINIENFNAARAWVDVEGQRLEPVEGARDRVMGVRIVGVKIHTHHTATNKTNVCRTPAILKS